LISPFGSKYFYELAEPAESVRGGGFTACGLLVNVSRDTNYRRSYGGVYDVITRNNMF